MKAGIITLFGNYNYGNRLQNQAVSTLLSDRGISSVTLTVRYGNVFVNQLWRMRNLLSDDIIINSADRLRRDNFKIYSKSLPQKYILSERDRERVVDEFDFLVIGSDQIWHPSVFMHYGEQFASFYPADKIVCLAPSFGVSQLPDSVMGAYREGLQRLPRVSVREQAGADIVEKLTGRRAEVLCDPTMGISVNRWLSEASVKPCPKTPYAFAYFLGGLEPADEDLLAAKARSFGMRYINILNRNNTTQYCADPNGFVGLISSASVVFTDSFHASVFAFLLHRPLAIFNRREHGLKTSSRLETLARTFGQSNRILSSPSELDDAHFNEIMDLNGSNVDEVAAHRSLVFNRYLDSELVRINN